MHQDYYFINITNSQFEKLPLLQSADSKRHHTLWFDPRISAADGKTRYLEKKKRLFHKSLTRVQYIYPQHHSFIKGLLLKVLAHTYFLKFKKKKDRKRKKSPIKLCLDPNQFSHCKIICGRIFSCAGQLHVQSDQAEMLFRSSY